jgi:hypothetical protein
MIEWLKKIWRDRRCRSVALLAFFLLVLFFILEFVTKLSDLGFSGEVTNYRWWILLFAAGMGVLVVVGYLLFSLNHEVNSLGREVAGLKKDKQDLMDQKESLFRLMEGYKADAQEDIFKRLRELALSSILQSKWKEKGARVERFRIEQLPPGNEDLHLNVSMDRVTTFINLGAADGVLIGMKFFVQDPTDLEKYGTIVIKDCHENGSTCSIIEVDRQGFWADVFEALRSPNDSPTIPASPNIIVPTSPYKELSLESAEELLNWLIKLEPVDL